MNNLTVEKLDTKHINAARTLIKSAYADVHGFKPLTENDLDTSEETVLFVGFIDDRLISFAYGSMVEAKTGCIRWGCVDREWRGACCSLGPIQACIDELRDNGAKQIHVVQWLDAPYRQLLKHFASKGIEVEHGELQMRIDMLQYRRQPPSTKEGYKVRAFRAGDEETWANVKNAVFGSSSTPADFWTQGFLGIRMDSDFDPQGFFFAEKNQKPVGICAGVVLHKRKKMSGTFLGGIGWTGVHEEHRGKGIGKALMICSLNYLHDNGIAITEIGTQFYRTAAVNLYEGLGFRIHVASFNLIL